MRKLRHRFLALLLLLTTLIMFAWQKQFAPQGTYQGKTARQWLTELKSWDGKSDAPLVQAFAKMGTNALPVFRKVMLEQTYSERVLGWLNEKQHTINFRIPFGLDKPTFTKRSELASGLFQALGRAGLPMLDSLLNDPVTANNAVSFMRPLGCDALPSLAHGSFNADLQARLMSIWGLGVIGRECENSDIVIPTLIKCLDDEDWRARYNAISALQKLHRSPYLVVRALKMRLKDKKAQVRALTAGTLGDFGENAKSAIPWLVTSLKDPDDEVSRCASNALAAIQFKISK